MVNFYIFNWQNEDHKALAQKAHDILYIDFDGREERIIRGHLLVEEDEHGYEHYKIVTRNNKFDADGKEFAPIKIRDEWERM